jgi:hypothetical protein
VSCSGTPGSAACGAIDGDIVPDAQQLDLFNALRTCDGVIASYAHYDCPHFLCGGFETHANCGGADALDWLTENGCNRAWPDVAIQYRMQRHPNCSLASVSEQIHHCTQ